MRGPSRPRLRSHGKLSGCSARRQQNVVALFLQHIARLWMPCAEESARTNGLGAWRYAAQASQAERFWHGRIAYTVFGCIARDAPSIMANALCTISNGFQGTDVLQPRGLVVQAHIGTHAIVIVWCQRCLGSLSALMFVQCYVHGRTAPCMHGYIVDVYMMRVLLCVGAPLAQSSERNVNMERSWSRSVSHFCTCDVAPEELNMPLFCKGGSKLCGKLAD